MGVYGCNRGLTQHSCRSHRRRRWRQAGRELRPSLPHQPCSSPVLPQVLDATNTVTHDYHDLKEVGSGRPAAAGTGVGAAACRIACFCGWVPQEPMQLERLVLALALVPPCRLRCS